MRIFRQLILLGVLLIPARNTVAQGASATRVRSNTAAGGVSGIVYDSVSQTPLAGALVQLVAGDSLATYGSTVTSNADGVFTFGNVPTGRYTLGFYHPMLDSLGLEPTAHAVVVTSSRTAFVNLFIPSPARLQTAICGTLSGPNAGALVMGFVRNTTDRSAVPAVQVAAEWVEYTLGNGGMTRHIARRVATTHTNGWFAICNAPKPGTVTLTASRDADSTGVVEIEIPSNGFFRHELYLGPARTVFVGDSMPTEGALPGTKRILVGNARLRGVVITADGGRPLADAQIGVVDGPQTRANARGEWSIDNAPEGTRAIEVRAVGYYPVRRAVNILHGAATGAEPSGGSALIRVDMVTFKSVLETVKVTANYAKYENRIGFLNRSRSGLGHFLSAEDIARRYNMVTSELFRMVPGLFLDGGSDPDKKIMMRGTFEERCVPVIYVNDHLMPELTADDLDNYVRPSEIAGIEVYSETQVPPQFQPGLNGCGSIVIWTK